MNRKIRRLERRHRTLKRQVAWGWAMFVLLMLCAAGGAIAVISGAGWGWALEYVLCANGALIILVIEIEEGGLIDAKEKVADDLEDAWNAAMLERDT